MSLSPLFHLTPTRPKIVAANHSPDNLGVTAFVNFWNVSILAWGGAGGTTPSLETQLKEGWVYMSGGAAAPESEDQDGILHNRERSQIVEIGIQLSHAPSRGKLLIRAELHSLGENAVVRVALNRSVIRTEQLAVGDCTVAVLVESPSDQAWSYIDLKHIQTPEGKASAFTFKSVLGYLA